MREQGVMTVKGDDERARDDDREGGDERAR